MKIVAYYRVSTTKQGRSGLGLDAQRQMVADFVASRGEIVEHLTEVESGKVLDRPVLAQAIALCRAIGATLVVAKLDRLSRDSEELAGYIKRLDFRVAAMPDADRFQLQIYAALAEQQARFISERTRAALAAAKARGVRLGNPNFQVGSAAICDHARKFNVAKSRAHAARVQPFITAAQKAGCASLQQLADALTARGVKTARGGATWHPATVQRVMEAAA